MPYLVLSNLTKSKIVVGSSVGTISSNSNLEVELSQAELDSISSTLINLASSGVIQYSISKSPRPEDERIETWSQKSVSIGPTEIWVDSLSGSDTNDGSVASPLRTLFEVRRRIPSILTHSYHVKLVARGASNPYDASALNGWGVLCLNGGLLLEGVGDFQLGTDLSVVSGSSTSLTVSGSPWSVDSLLGYYVEVVRSNGRVIRRSIVSNTADTIVVSAMDSTDTTGSVTPHTSIPFDSTDIIRVVYPNTYLTCNEFIEWRGNLGSYSVGEGNAVLSSTSSPTVYLANVTLTTSVPAAFLSLENGCLFGVGSAFNVTPYAPFMGAQQHYVSRGVAAAGFVSDGSIWQGSGVYYPSSWRSSTGGQAVVYGVFRAVIAGPQDDAFFVGRIFGGSGTSVGVVEARGGGKITIGLSPGVTSTVIRPTGSNESVRALSGGSLVLNSVDEISLTFSASRDAVLASGPGSFVYINASNLNSISSTRYGVRSIFGGKVQVDGSLSGKITATTADLAAGSTPVTATAASLIVNSPVIGGAVLDGSLVIRTS